MRRHETPGRIEALRHVLQAGTANAAPGMLQLAGMGKAPQQRMPSLPCSVHTYSSGTDDHLTDAERAALPF